MDLQKMKYTIKHRRAFREVEKQILGKNTIRSLFHDADKLLLLVFIDKKTASKIHRKYSRHHNRAHTKSDYIQMIIDWECARYTKPDKPLNARDTLYAYYSDMSYIMEPILEELGL